MTNNLVPIQVAVSEDTRWQSEVAARLMYQLVASFPHLGLGIRATADHISWLVGVPTGKMAAIKHAVEAFYPHSQVTKLVNIDNDQLPGDTRTYRWTAARPFIFPFRVVKDCHLDPLASLVTALTSVKPGEEMVYFLEISVPTKDYNQEVKRLFTPSVGRTIWWGIREQVLRLVPTSSIEMQQYRELQDLANNKMKSPLTKVELTVTVTTTSEARSLQLANLIGQTFSQFDSDLNVITNPSSEAYDLVLSPDEIATMWHLPTEGSYHRRVVWATSTPVELFQAPSIAQKTDYVVLGNSKYVGQFHSVHLAYRDRRNHINIVGSTEMGKTTLLANLIRQDIENGKAVAVIDPIGKLINQVLPTIPREREKDVILFDAADREYPIGLNLLAKPSIIPPDEAAPEIFNIFRKFFARDLTEFVLAQQAFNMVIATLLYEPGATVMEMHRLFTDPLYRARIVAHIDDYRLSSHWQMFEKRSPGDKTRFSDPVLRRIDPFFNSLTLTRITCQTNCLDFREMMDTNKIFLASLGGVPDLIAQTLGALLVIKFQMAARSRAGLGKLTEHPPLMYLYIDEAKDLASDSLGDLFDKGRNFGLSLVTAHQHFSQLEGGALEAVLGNVGTNICFRVYKNSADYLAGLMRPEFTTDDLQQLDKYTAVVKMQKQGQTLPAFLLYTLPPLALPDDSAKIDRIRQYSRQTYGQPASEVDAELKRRYTPSKPDQPSSDPLPTDLSQSQSSTPIVPLRGDVNIEELWHGEEKPTNS